MTHTSSAPIQAWIIENAQRYTPLQARLEIRVLFGVEYSPGALRQLLIRINRKVSPKVAFLQGSYGDDRLWNMSNAQQRAQVIRRRRKRKRHACPGTPDCKFCKIAARIKEIRATSSRYPGLRKDGWTYEQEAWLRERLGTETTFTLARQITEVFGIKRTPKAIGVRALHLGLSAFWTFLTPKLVAQLFRATDKRVYRWIKNGMLSAKLLENTVMANARRIDDEHLEAFIKGYPWAYDWRQMRPGRWRAIAELTARRERWVKTSEACAYLGISVFTIHRWREQGIVKAARRPGDETSWYWQLNGCTPNQPDRRGGVSGLSTGQQLHEEVHREPEEYGRDHRR